MKKVFFSTVIFLSLNVTFAVAQAQSTFEAKNQEQTANNPTAPDSKVGSTGSDHAPSRTIRRITITSLPIDEPETKTNESTSVAASPPVPAITESASAAISPLVPTSIYLVGVGDVLDIQLRNSPIRESTLYSVLAGGMLDYPLAGDTVMASGLTTEEISAKLASKIKIYDNPQVTVNVREYASHNVIVTGLVNDPGTKALQREAVPLFILLAEAQPRADAARALIMRAGSPAQTIDISDTNATSVLIYPNDIIRLVAAPPPAPLFFYIVGQIAMPGQRDFHSGMTLTQSIFASGGATRSAGSKAKVMRQGPDGRLLTTEYNLKRIELGKDPDPQIEAGDRIEVSR